MAVYSANYIGPLRPGDIRAGSIPMSSSVNPAAMNYQPTNFSPMRGPTGPSGNPIIPFTSQPAPTRNNPMDGRSNQSTSTNNNPPPSVYIAPDGNTYASQQDYQNQLNAQIESIYNPSFDYLNQAEGALRADLPNALSAAESAYNTNISTLGGQRAAAGQNLDTQKNKAQSTYENALADARRMYQEQQIGAQQRFGGSTSAGGAFSEIQGREQARQYGQTSRQFTDLTNQIEFQRQNVEREYQTGLLQLQQQKQEAISTANRDFQNKLLQIANNRAQLGQAKATARLDALQQLRNEIFAIEQQNKQFEQTLALQKQQAQIQLGNFGGVSTVATNQTGQLVNNYDPFMGSGVPATGGLSGQASGQAYTGSIRRPEDEYTGAVNRNYLNPLSRDFLY